MKPTNLRCYSYVPTDTYVRLKNLRYRKGVSCKWYLNDLL